MNEQHVTAKDIAILCAILLLATALRIVGLNSVLWFDEIVTVLSHLRAPWDQMMLSYEMNHHYLYSFQAKISSDIFGESAWSVRLPAMVFGVASIAALWWVAHRIAGAMSAHATALLATLSYHHIWFSQNARGYTELMFWSLLGLGLFLVGIRKPTKGIWIAFALTLALAAFTHLTGVFFFATLGVVWLGWLASRAVAGDGVTKPQLLAPLAGFAGGLILTALAYSPILPTVISNAMEVNEGSAIDLMKEYQNPIWTLFETVATLGAQGPLALLVLSTAIGLALIGSFSRRRHEPLIGFVTFGHIILTMVVLVFLGMRVWPRFFFVDIGLLLFLIFEGVRAVCLWIGTRIPSLQRVALPISFAGMVAISIGLAAKNYTAPKQDMAGAIALAQVSRTQNEPIYVLGVAAHLARDFYGDHVQPVLLPEEFTAVENTTDPAWLVVPFPARTFRDFSTLDATIQDGFDLVKMFPGSLGDGNVLLYHRPGQE